MDRRGSRMREAQCGRSPGGMRGAQPLFTGKRRKDMGEVTADGGETDMDAGGMRRYAFWALLCCADFARRASGGVQKAHGVGAAREFYYNFMKNVIIFRGKEKIFEFSEKIFGNPEKIVSLSSEGNGKSRRRSLKKQPAEAGGIPGRGKSFSALPKVRSGGRGVEAVCGVPYPREAFGRPE